MATILESVRETWEETGTLGVKKSLKFPPALVTESTRPKVPGYLVLLEESFHRWEKSI